MKGIYYRYLSHCLIDFLLFESVFDCANEEILLLELFHCYCEGVHIRKRNEFIFKGFQYIIDIYLEFFKSIILEYRSFFKFSLRSFMLHETLSFKFRRSFGRDSRRSEVDIFRDSIRGIFPS
jgi:hypothetical protein